MKKTVGAFEKGSHFSKQKYTWGQREDFICLKKRQLVPQRMFHFRRKKMTRARQKVLPSSNIGICDP